MHDSRNGFLTRKGYDLRQEIAQREFELSEVDGMDESLYLDSRVSMSGLRRDEDMYALVSDVTIDEQARRFHNGS